MNAKLFLITTFILGAAGSAEAATFKAVKTLKNASLQKVAVFAGSFEKQKDLFDDCTKVESYSIARKQSEENINTIKQLNISRNGLFYSDGETPVAVRSDTTIDTLITTLFSDLSQGENYASLAPTQKKLADLVTQATGKLDASSLELYEANHANEDGSWNILDILDTENEEVLTIQVGGCGT
ncbi:MAG: hypothetical protein ABIR96_04335 [Bdellovibrionota bacterium]